MDASSATLTESGLNASRRNVHDDIARAKAAGFDQHLTKPVDPDRATFAELDALVTFLQADSERRGSSVARKLHDDLGGFVIGAMMDVAWIEQHDSKLPPDTVMRLARVNEGLRGAIDLTRKIVEELRPTLLDSVGLFAALSWHFKQGCRQAGIRYTESFPASAPEMDAHRLISLFRIAQGLFHIARGDDVADIQHLQLSRQHTAQRLEITYGYRTPLI